ncbi:DUF2190 family protein [Microbulbifer sp. EKSA005]|uniref:DUF2190 family protein n=1 Tax=Microbulbifer sp. EKSA005 TaxID=3243364 RepID=UPI004042AB3C
MAADIVQARHNLDYANNTCAAIASGQVVIDVKLVMAMDDIVADESGVIDIDGVFTVPKVTAAESIFSKWNKIGSYDGGGAEPAGE